MCLNDQWSLGFKRQRGEPVVAHRSPRAEHDVLHALSRRALGVVPLTLNSAAAVQRELRPTNHPTIDEPSAMRCKSIHTIAIGEPRMTYGITT